jgi:subtilase family serine protease
VKNSSLRISSVLVGFLLALAVALGAAPTLCLSASTPSPVRLHGHVPTKAIAAANRLERLAPDTRISMTFTLPLRNQDELQNLIERIYDPNDPLYGHYLTPGEFTNRFGPSQEDYDALAAYAKSQGLAVTGTHPNRALLDVSGPAGTIETAFNLHLHHYQTQEGRKFHAPDNDPEVPDFIASRITGITGLNNHNVRHTYNRFRPAAEIAQSTPNSGSSLDGGMTPNDILTAYNLQGVAPTGSGQTIALFELDGYNASDVTHYANYYGLPAIQLENVRIPPASGTAGIDADEVTLDIELLMALAPGVSKIIVYEGDNSDQGTLDTYNKIANDNLARQVSTSWGISEDHMSLNDFNTENSIFQQMAAQGQSIYAAAGDNGAYDNPKTPSTLRVDDPASQPFMVGVGGTRLFVNADRTYNYESCWNDGGGGVSSHWNIPTWQQGVVAASSTKRNVPDVALNADPNTGYSIYSQGSWGTFGGTSCAAPLWAAFTARVNQKRAADGKTPLGFANLAIYQIATGSNYGTDFHDIADGSTNLHYSATPSYDNATGWGSFNGANLLADLAPSLVPDAPTIGTVINGNARVKVAFTPPVPNGGSPISIYTVTSSPGGIIATGTTSPITVTGLTNGTPYTFTVTATNAAGTGPASAASDTVNVGVTQPTVGSFTVITPINKTTVPITAFTASDLGGSTITGYRITKTSTAPLATAAGWSTTPQTSYTVPASGTYTLYAWARDGTGNVSAAIAPQTVVVDRTKPVVTVFKTASSVTSTTVPVIDFKATDSGGSGLAASAYMITESAIAPLATTAGWSATPQTSYTFLGAWTSGTKRLYAWAMDNAGNVSRAKTSTVLLDTTAPTVSRFTVAASSSTLTVRITFTATDHAGGSGIAGYLITESSTPPDDSAAWSAIKPTSYTATSGGVKTLYAWAKDKAGNVSAVGVGTSGTVNFN